MAEEKPPPEHIYLSRGKSKGSWEYNGCWGVFPFPADVGNVEYIRADLARTPSVPQAQKALDVEWALGKLAEAQKEHQ